MRKENAVIIGGAGFVGTALTKRLRQKNVVVYNVIRPNSRHKDRLNGLDDELHILECELKDLANLRNSIAEGIDVMYYIAWTDELGLLGQYNNIGYLLNALELASKVKCKRIVITGSQAEYGIVPKDELIVENRSLNPFSDYGASKVAACYLSRQYASDLGIEWVWGRIFSLIGKNEPEMRMLPSLYRAIREGNSFSLSSCRQNWDYLDVYDAADALIALAKAGKNGEIYNIANGGYRELKEYVQEIINIVDNNASVTYGGDTNPFVSLQPSVEKIYLETGWRAKRSFKESIMAYED